MKRFLFTLLCWLPLLAAAQSVTVPTTMDFAGLHLRLTNGGRKVLQQKVDAIRSHQASFQSRVNLADAYFPIIERVFQEEGLPLDFRFLALQESGLQGEAHSIHDAVGYWQFKRESAADFGLVMNEVVDERKHIVASSHAAAKYLQRNNVPLHNWVNALLSYNLGSGGVKPFVLPIDFDATEKEISEKTHPYVLTMLAHKLAYEPAVGQNPKPPLSFQEFPAPAGFTLVSIAQTLQADPAEMARHNRWLLTSTIPGDRIYTVMVPVVGDVQLTAIAAQQKTATTGQLLHQPKIDPQNTDYVRVNGLRALVALPGDTKESLAKRTGLKVRKFMQFNDLFAFDNIVVGQPYFVQKKRDKGEVEYHVAQPGESVATVSQKYGVRAKAIWSKNRMPRNEELRPGRILWLQHTRPREVAIEYADSKNEAALAAFERPVNRAEAAAPSATASATPATSPSSTATPTTKPAPTPKKRRADEVDPYMGSTASTVRTLEDATETLEEPESGSTATQPDSATDAATENLNELPPASVAKPTPAPKTTPAPSTPPPAAPPRGVYTGQPAKKPLPASTPVGDEPVIEESTATVAAPRSASKPASVSSSPVAKPASAAPATAATPKPAPTVMPAASSPDAPKPTAAPVMAATSAVEAVPANGLHIVQPKEGLYAVARRYGLRPADLIAWNNLSQNPSLRIGQTLRVVAASPAAEATPTPAKAVTSTGTYQPKAPTTSSASTVTLTTTPAPTVTASAAPAPTADPALATVRHKVAAGESMYAISRKYGVTIKQIMEWNSKADFNVKPGEVLVIQPTK